jgi:hypothetical protein
MPTNNTLDLILGSFALLILLAGLFMLLSGVIKMGD